MWRDCLELCLGLVKIGIEHLQPGLLAFRVQPSVLDGRVHQGDGGGFAFIFFLFLESLYLRVQRLFLCFQRDVLRLELVTEPDDLLYFVGNGLFACIVRQFQ